MIKYYNIGNNRLTECPKEESLVIAYIGPTGEEITEIVQKYSIDEYDIHSSLDANELSRVEFEDDYTLMILKRPENYSASDNLLFHVNSMGIFLHKDKMIVVLSEDIQIFEGRQFSKIKTRSDILLKILYGIISHFLGHLKVINMVSDEIEQKINASMENKHLLNMFTLEKSLVYYLEGISSNAKLIDKIKINANKIGFTPDNMDMLDDIIIENQQCLKQAEIYLNILTGLMDARGSIVNNNLNILIKRLTIINIVFMPLNLLAGIGGMSEFSMMTTGIDWRIAYSLFLLAMAAIGVLGYVFLNKMGSEK